MHISAHNQHNKRLGTWGEDYACEFLQSKGYRIIERNFHIRGGEIDIVAQDGDNMVIVEVKTRSGDNFGTPLDAVTKNKQRLLMRAIREYRHVRDNYGRYVRCDVIGILLDRVHMRVRIEHVKDVLQFDV